MSRTIKGSKGPGYEYWGRRPFCGWKPGKVAKRLTHQLERQIAKREVRRECEAAK